jgi:predicted secreted protein
MKSIDRSFDNTTVQIAVGDKLTISLEEIPTTGFIWVLVTNMPSSLQTISDEFVQQGNSEAPMRAGAGGYRKLVYQAIEKGQAVLSFVKRRPWEDGEITNERFTVAIVVE